MNSTQRTRSTAPDITRRRGSKALAIAVTASLAGTLATATILSRTASAHEVMTMPLPRAQGAPGGAIGGFTNGPCGIARAANQPVTTPPLTAGAQLMVTWSETINHPGCFLVDFSAANDLNFQPLATLPHSNAGAIPRRYSTTVTLPAMPCPACTLRVRQIQLGAEPAAGTCPQTGLTTYFSCANVVLAGDGGPGGGASGGASGTGGATVTATGGRTGAGGGPGSGGRTGSGGQTSEGTGGAAAVVVGASGGQTGSGGSPGSGGAATTTTNGPTGSGGATGADATSGAPAGESSSSGGCDLVAAPQAGLASLFGLLLLAALAIARRRAPNHDSDRQIDRLRIG